MGSETIRYLHNFHSSINVFFSLNVCRRSQPCTRTSVTGTSLSGSTVAEHTTDGISEETKVPLTGHPSPAARLGGATFLSKSALEPVSTCCHHRLKYSLIRVYFPSSSPTVMVNGIYTPPLNVVSNESLSMSRALNADEIRIRCQSGSGQSPQASAVRSESGALPSRRP